MHTSTCSLLQVLTLSDGEEFIHVARLNLARYANKPELARNLFEYLFFVVQEIRLALNLASMVCNKPNASDLKGITSIGDGRYEEWWWKLQKAKCFYRLGLLRESDTVAQESNEILPTIETFLLRGAISLRQNQPLKALSLYRDGLLRFPKDPELMSNAARIHENIGEMLKSIDVYKDVIRVDNTNIEALSSFGTHYFYEDQPELALKFFRRILQLGFQSAELFNNLGLCSYYAQQYDVCLSYFQKAIEMCNLENAADVYFSLAHIGINIGDLKLAYQCLRIALAYDNNHSEAYNNLGVIEERRGNFSAVGDYCTKQYGLQAAERSDLRMVDAT
ncbi:unnamed protein product [Calicophoron daubneyi]|uniref:Tetratricopeptide repeat protein 8 n=1 Tax=Calicophoron daubneyi TaxID=300641 RepID=A0AAV2TD31_CALDB